MFAGVGEDFVLALVSLYAAIVIRPSLSRIFIIYIEVNEDVWFADPLPHIGDEGVLLCGLADDVALRHECLA